MNSLKHLILAGAIALSGSLAAMEGGHEGKGGPGGGGPMKHILKKLDLTKEQKAKLKDLGKARRERNQAIGNKLEDAREALEDLLEVADKSKAHEAKLRAKNEEVLKLQQEKQKEHFESLLEIRSVLTDEQLKKFVDLHDKMMDHREHRMEMRKKGGKGGPMGMMGGKGKPEDKDDDKDGDEKGHEGHDHGDKD